ncbi:hypothetical protein M378DRAFT_130749 [Amanita muscaria Koide BX008]|uniref:T6SS Phospholipase effector Tle1-like catalytic domain-containing protein n=1 Tax=Amanita muscaria (strain Koide BX008) TaxID=946122 RepID=A0A0C2WUD3_AMAMK|nr:hypothetical protein M378DRAFT_130749 [Amanita muscaria Koide BX008]
MSPRQEPSLFQLLDFNGDSLRGATVHESQNTSQNGEGGVMISPIQGEGRVMILCFDGTGNKFGAVNSNIVRFFRALQKDDRKKQIVYYQPGIGTYTKRTFITHAANTVASTLDQAVALHLDDHVKEGYQFIVQNYRPGDRICVFGFSRGAHTARVVAGMVYKVGVLPKENIQQVDFAFSIYSTTGYNGYKLSQEFKRTFTPASAYHQVSVDFVGVWDTVSSVGIIPKVHPYTSVNYAVKKFRHALSLDERRARFRPNVWSEITLAREHELDVDIPVTDIPHTGQLNRDDFEYKPPDRDFADVKEVWFAGTHADVGGGSHDVKRSSSLSFIPLRWMIKECILSETGIMFDLNYLQDDLDFDFDGLLKEIGDETEKQKRIIQYVGLKACRDAQVEERNRYHGTKDAAKDTTHTEDDPRPRLLIQRIGRHARDILDDIFDQLVIFWYFWWMLEMIPMLYAYQDFHGNWIRRRMRNFGRGRYIPVYKNKVLVHTSVKERIAEKGGEKQDGTRAKIRGLFNILLDRFRNRDKYTPRAYNWDYLQEQKVIEYVD